MRLLFALSVLTSGTLSILPRIYKKGEEFCITIPRRKPADGVVIRDIHHNHPYDTVVVEAFHLPIPLTQTPGRACYALAQREQGGEMDRRALMRFTATALGALGITNLGSSSAFAASPVINEIKIRESVKGVKESVEALKLYEDFVTQKDFYGIKKSLRVPPVSDIRKDCRRIIAGLDGKQKSETDTAYNKFIQSLESVDLIATRAIQNDNEIKEDDFKNLGSKYQETQTYLEIFLDVVLETPYATPINIRIEQP